MALYDIIDATVTIDGYEFTATIHPDYDHGAPWEDCGHGPVSNWTTRDKLPGELILNRDGPAKRFYDFAAACKIARRDAWGVAPYSVTSEQGANGLIRLTGHWFDAGNTLHDHRTEWHDCPNEAHSELYAMHRASMSKRQYAALAAIQDYERLRDWCNDKWGYVGVVLTVAGQARQWSLWGLESDDHAYLQTVANELLEDALQELPNHRVMLAADIGV